MTKATDKTEPSRDVYYAAAASWAQDRRDDLLASRRVAWIVASVAVVVALFEATALVLLMPLKTVEPYTLMVDRNTGYVQALKPIDAQKIAPDTALTQSFLAQYVIARESFDANELQSNYRKVALWSINPARADYVSSVQATNPASPLALLPRSTVVETVVKSVSPLGGQVVLVRFDTIRRDAGGQGLPPRSWVAIVKYRFSTGALEQSDRLLNPLGFQVVSYRRDQERVAPAVEPAPAPPPTSGAAPATLSRQPANRGLPPVLPPPPAYQGPPRATVTGREVEL